MDEVKKFNWKTAGYWTLGVVCAWALFIYAGENMDKVIAWKVNREAKIVDAAIHADIEKLADMERADTYGGTTPEGTIALIITALEKGDIDLASKYYYVLDQEKARASFAGQLREKGNLDIAITFFKDLLKGTKGCNAKGDGCTFEYEYIREKDESFTLPGTTTPQFFPKGSKSTKSNDFDLNRYTEIWKARE